MSQNVKPNAESYNAYEVIKDLNTYVYSNKFVKGINIFFNNETVITNEYKAGYELYFNDLNKTQIDHKSIISEYNHRNLVYERDTEGSFGKLYYVNSLPVGSRKNWKATVVIEMDLDIISAFLQNNQFTERTETVLRNSEQKIILTHNPMTAKSNNINAIRTQAKSEILGWEIESIIPKTEFEEKLMSIRSVIISILLLSLLVVLIFASYFAYRHNRPIARLIGLVHEETMDIIKEDIFSHIEESISKTINENKELKRKIMKQTEYLTDNAVEKLLKKEIQSIKDSENMMDVPYIKLKSAKFVVFSIKLYINSACNIDYSEIICKLKGILKDEQDGYVFYINESNISILIEIVNEQVFNQSEFGKNIIQVLSGFGIQSAVGIGRIYSSVDDINISYKQALQSLNAMHGIKGEILDQLYNSETVNDAYIL